MAPEIPGSSPNNPIILSPIPNVQIPTLHTASGASIINFPELDGDEGQSLTHRYQSSTPDVAPTSTLEAEVDKAISWANKLGDPYLGRAVRYVYELSMDNPRIARLMESVLVQSPTVEQESEFQVLVQYTRARLVDADERSASPSMAEDFESDNEEESDESLVAEGTSVDPEDMDDDDSGYDASTLSSPSVPSSPSTLKGDEVQEDLSQEAVWGAIALQYMQKEQLD